MRNKSTDVNGHTCPFNILRISVADGSRLCTYKEGRHPTVRIVIVAFPIDCMPRQATINGCVNAAPSVDAA